MDVQASTVAELTTPIRVIAADHQPLFRQAVVAAISTHPRLEMVGDAQDGREALEMIQQRHPDVAVLDSALPELDGASVLKAVVRDALETKVVLLSEEVDAQLAYDVMEVGAAGVLCKDAQGAELCKAIQSVAQGQTIVDDRLMTGLAHEIRLRRDRDEPVLSEREQQVLRLLSEGLNAPEIGSKLSIGTATVRTHLGNMYTKFEVRGQAPLVAEAMRRGYLE